MRRDFGILPKFDQWVREPLRSFDQNGPFLPYGSLWSPEEVKGNLETAKTLVSDHINEINRKIKDGEIPPDLGGEITNALRDSYFTSMVSDKDWGAAQAAYAVSNISPETIRKIPKGPPHEVIETIAETVDRPKFKTPFERTEYVKKLSDSLMEIKPSDSLLLIREQALSNDYR